MHLSQILKPSALLAVLLLNFLFVAPTVGALLPHQFVVSSHLLGIGIFAICFVIGIAVWCALSAMFELISMLRSRNKASVVRTTALGDPLSAQKRGFLGRIR